MRKPRKSGISYKRSPGTFSAIPHAVGLAANYCKLSRDAKALLLDLAMQMKTHINGTLVVTLKAQREQGWTSKAILYRARDELIYYGYLILTRQGGRNRASYYALTFYNIQAADLDIRRTAEAPDYYKEEVPEFEGRPRKRKPPEKQNRCPSHKDNLSQLQGQSASEDFPLSQLPGQSEPISAPHCPCNWEPSNNHLPRAIWKPALVLDGLWHPPWTLNH